MAGRAQSRIAYIVGRLDRAVRQRLGEVTRRFGLTVAQYTTLSVLAARGSLSNAQLARRAFVSPQAMNEIVAAMTAKAMLARTPDAQHGRIVRISLTRKGGQVLRQCDAAARRVEEEMLAGLSRTKQALLLGLLGTCVVALEHRSAARALTCGPTRTILQATREPVGPRGAAGSRGRTRGAPARG
ncbi:MAG: MarR family winged helix-turn-helix transcriptional regulator [Steroidobacteraceae bacterium]